ncbi:tetratricopeptide repeat protein [Endomicrobium proavitum]|uniref:Uncharacterized protein n=1 Tax=Endomicrobium proavitum TaxID=1408281 RepID=A0A0G3WJ83_9BACT|nr:tetratricopeptide repeat protein [Endomicrobium proavitum]AKL98388.1 membrane protein of unknown function [Endomicrobium proavitum]
MENTNSGVSFLKKYQTILLAALVFAVAFLVYANTINYKLTDLDDENFIHNYAYKYQPASAFSEAFKQNVLFGGPTPYYRPVLSLSFVTSYKIAGQSESFAHFVNVLLHALCALLLFVFLRHYLFDDKISFLAAALFALHPLTIYTAAWIPGRNDSLFFINFILAFTFFIEYLNTKKFGFILLNALFTLLCFFTKESGLAVAFIFIFYYITHFKKYGKLDLKKSAICIALWIITMSIFWIARKAAMGPAGVQGLNLRPDNIRMFFDYYASAIFMTTPFRALYGTIEPYFYPLGIFAAGLTVFFAFFKKNKEQKYENFFWLTLPLIMLAPNLIGERLWFQGNRMYVPLFAIIILFFSFLQPYLKTKKTAAQTVIAVIFVIAVIGTLNGSAGFKNSLTFWNKMINESAYEHITAKKFRVTAYIKNGDTQTAAKEALYIAQISRFSDPEIMYLLGLAFLQNGNYKEAIQVYEMLISNGQMLIPPTYASLVLAYSYENNKQKAEYYFGELVKTLNASPNDALGYLQSYKAYLQSQKGQALRK